MKAEVKEASEGKEAMAKKKKKKITAVKKKTRKKRVTKKVAKKTRRRGRPRGAKNVKRRGRGAGRIARATENSITLPVDTKTNIAFWSEMVVFLNKNQGKSFVVQMDGVKYSLRAS